VASSASQRKREIKNKSKVLENLNREWSEGATYSCFSQLRALGANVRFDLLFSPYYNFKKNCEWFHIAEDFGLLKNPQRWQSLRERNEFLKNSAGFKLLHKRGRF